MNELTPLQDRVQEAIARVVAQPEFDRRLAEEFMGWQKMPDEAWYANDEAGNLQQVAAPGWSPTTDANAATQLMRSPRWCDRYPTSVVLFGSSPKSPIIVASEDPKTGIIELARDNRMPMAISIAAIRILGPSQIDARELVAVEDRN